MSHHLVDSAGGIDFPVAYPVDSDLSGALNSHHSNNWGQISFKPDNHTDPATEIFVHKMFKQMQQATTKNFGWSWIRVGAIANTSDKLKS